MAGSIVWIVALPMAIAFGIASGVTPEQGLITAIIGGFIVSFLGGSKVQIAGPTGTFLIIVCGIIQQFGTSGLIVATFMAGVILVFMGIFKLGNVIKFVPYPVVIGFTGGIALVILSTQIKDLLGLKIDNLPSDFVHQWMTYYNHFDHINYWSFGAGLLTLAIIITTSLISRRIPGSLLAIVIVTIGVYLLRTYCGVSSIETIGDRFEIQASIPQPIAPQIDFNMIRLLFPAAFTIAILGAIESLLSAIVADGAIGDKHRSNTELIAQGVANIVVPFFGGLPTTGAVARTMTNINNGARTPVAGMIHAVILLLVLLFLGDLAGYIPMSCLAAVLVMVSYQMSGWRTIRGMLHNPKSDVAVLFTTFFLTIIFDLTIAIEVGLLMAVVLFVRRSNEAAVVRHFSKELDPSDNLDIELHEEFLAIPDGVDVYEIEGPYFFGVANKFDEIMSQVANKPIVRIIRMRKVPFIDSTGLHNLEALYRTSQKEGIHLILSGVNKHVKATIEKSGFYDELGGDNICECVNRALEIADQIVKTSATAPKKRG